MNMKMYLRWKGHQRVDVYIWCQKQPVSVKPSGANTWHMQMQSCTVQYRYAGGAFVDKQYFHLLITEWMFPSNEHEDEIVLLSDFAPLANGRYTTNYLPSIPPRPFYLARPNKILCKHCRSISFVFHIKFLIEVVFHFSLAPRTNYSR
jgi:hypothetical protein